MGNIYWKFPATFWEVLNKMGADGWEFVAQHNVSYFYFKRPSFLRIPAVRAVRAGEILLGSRERYIDIWALSVTLKEQTMSKQPSPVSATVLLPLPVRMIERRIYAIRGKNVMIDRDLAELYQVKAIALRQQVKRNRVRFPDDFMFQLSQFGRISALCLHPTGDCDALFRGDGRPGRASQHRNHASVRQTSGAEQNRGQMAQRIAILCSGDTFS